MIHETEAPYMNDKCLYTTPKVLKNKRAVLVKSIFNEVQPLKSRINGYDNDLDLLEKNSHHILTMIHKDFYGMAVTPKNHHLATKY